MAEKKQSYTVDSPIKRNGKLYEPGATMKLTEEEADGLNVSPAKGSAGKADDEDKGEKKKAPEKSTEIGAKEAIKMIETAEFTALEGFVPDEEDRSTVTEAWEKRQAEHAEES